MMPLCNKALGMSVGFPDPKMTPPLGAPIPYPNMALNVMHVPFSPNIFVGFVPQQTMLSTAPMTLGNQAGAMHPLFMMFGGQTTGKPNYLVNGMPAKHLLNSTYGNCFNNPLGVVAVPSITTTFASDRAARPASFEMGAEALCALDRALCGDRELVVGRQLAPGVGLVSLRRFSRDAPTRFFNALRGLDVTRGLVIDLRGNPGGDFQAAIEIAGDLLPRGVTITVRVLDGEPRAVRNRFRPSYVGPLVLLVDGRTASSAELVAASLKFHRRATLVGATTYGKASVQGPRQGVDDRVTYETVAMWRAPDGSEVHGRGVTPDVASADGEALALSML